jgi:hypothetical protein
VSFGPDVMLDDVRETIAHKLRVAVDAVEFHSP